MKLNCQYTNFYTKDIKDSILQQFGVGEFTGKEFTEITTTITKLYEDKLRKCIYKVHGFDLLNLFLNSFDSAYLLKKNEITLQIDDNIDSPTVLKQCFKYGLEVFVEVSDTITDDLCKESDWDEITCLLREIVHLSHTVALHRINNSGKLILSENNSDFGTKFINYYSSNTNEYQFIMDKSLKIYREKYIKEFNNGRFVIDLIKNEGLKCILDDKLGNLSFEEGEAVFQFLMYYNGKIPINILQKSLALRFSTIDTGNLLKIIDGFSLSTEQIEDNNRFYRPNRINRLYSKGLLKLKYKGKRYYFYSPALFSEGCGLFLESITYGITPSSICDEKKVKTIQGKYSKKFENYVIEKFKNNGWMGGNRKIGEGFLGLNKLKLPEEIGEIDGLVFSEKDNRIIVLELKTNKLAAHTVQISNELNKFRDEGYFEQIKKKYKHIQSIKDLLIEEVVESLKIKLTKEAEIIPLLVTERPTINEIYNEYNIECINFIRLFEKLGL